MRDGSYRPLFIDKSTPFVYNEWVDAECHPTNGFAVRKGFHLCLTPNAPHLKERLSNGERRVWCKFEVDDYEYFDRPESQGGKWVLAQKVRLLGEMVYFKIEDDKLYSIMPTNFGGDAVNFVKEGEESGLRLLAEGFGWEEIDYE